MLFLGAMTGVDLFGQPGGSHSVAEIVDIQIKQNGKLDTPKDWPTELVRLRHANDSSWKPTHYENESDSLFWGDSLRLNNKAYAKILACDDRNISVVCNADSGYKTLIDKELDIDLEQEGLYVIETPSGEHGLWGIRIQKGIATAEIKKEGKLVAIVAANESVISGNSTTRVLFIANADSTGLIYLEKGKSGSLVFPDSLEFDRSIRGSLREGEIARVERGKVIEIFTLENALKALVLRWYVRLIHKNLWKSWFLRPIPFLLVTTPTATTAGVVIYDVIVNGLNGNDKPNGLPEPPPVPPND
jgi:hypothetical protein